MGIPFASHPHRKLVLVVSEDGGTQGSLTNWIEFVGPAIGSFGLNPPDNNWTLPADETDRTLVYGYHAASGNNGVSPFGTLNLVNLANTLKDHPDEGRTHIVLDYFFEPFTGDDVGRFGHIRCEVYRGPPLAEIIEHLNSSEIYNALGNSFDTVRTAFQYRRDGVIGRLAEHEEGITTASEWQQMRIRIPVVGEGPHPHIRADLMPEI